MEYSEGQSLEGKQQEIYLQVAEGVLTKLQVGDESRREKVSRKRRRKLSEIGKQRLSVTFQHMRRWSNSHSCLHMSELLSVNPRGVTFQYITGLYMRYRDHPEEGSGGVTGRGGLGGEWCGRERQRSK